MEKAALIYSINLQITKVPFTEIWHIFRAKPRASFEKKYWCLSLVETILVLTVFLSLTKWGLNPSFVRFKSWNIKFCSGILYHIHIYIYQVQMHFIIVSCWNIELIIDCYDNKKNTRQNFLFLQRGAFYISWLLKWGGTNHILLLSPTDWDFSLSNKWWFSGVILTKKLL